MPILTSEAIEAALGAVIERTNSTGALCHEETIGNVSLHTLHTIWIEYNFGSR